MHVGADVALIGDERRPCVQADAQADGTWLEPLGDGSCGLESSGRRGEGDEESVPLRVDLDSSGGHARLAHNTPMLRERSRISFHAELVQELG